MEINNGRYVNFQSVGFSKKNIEKPVSSSGETKKAAASSMDALSASGRAFVNMSFKGNSVNSSSTEIKELTDEEFEELKKKLEEKLKTLPENVRRSIYVPILTKEDILIAEKILSGESLHGNENFMNEVWDIICWTKTPEEAQIKLDLMNKIIFNKSLHGNESFMNKAGDIIYRTNTPEEARIVNRILKYEECSPNQIVALFLDENKELSLHDIKKINRVMGKKIAYNLSKDELIIAAKFIDTYNKKNINEIPINKKNKLLRNLVSVIPNFLIYRMI